MSARGSPARFDPGTSGCLALVALLALASVLPAPYVTLWPDTVRDLSASLALARGESLPLVGPPVNFGPHLGPAWIWLQAVVLVFVPSLAAAGVYVAALASVKLFLLFYLGRAVSGDLMGLSFAAAGAFPSIAAYQWLVFFHPNVVETAIAAVLLLCALSARGKSIPMAYLAAAALGFAVQMHATAVLYAPAVAWAIWTASEKPARAILHGAVAALLVAAWFVPLLFAGAPGEKQAMGTLASGVGSSLADFSIADLLTVLRTAYVDVPVAIGATYAGKLGVPSWLWNGAILFVAASAAAGAALHIAGGGRECRVQLSLLALVIAGWTAACAARSYTSFYLCYFVLPISALAVGHGFARLASSPAAAARAWGLGAIAMAILCSIASGIGARLVGQEALMSSRLPVIADLKHPSPDTFRAVLVTARARDKVARHLCAASGAALHGELAYGLAGSALLDFRLHCPDRMPDIRLFGLTPAGSGLTAVAEADAQALRRTPYERFSGLAAFRVKDAIHPRESRTMDREWSYFERLRDRAPLTRVELDFSTSPGDVVVVHRLKPFDSRWQGYRVLRDSAPVPPAKSTYNSDLFASGALPVTRWRVEFETDAPHWVDVHVF